MDMENKNYHRITVADMAPHVHKFLSGENKVNKILAWLKNWIELSLECGKITPYDLLPSKADLAYHIGVSQGTIQSVFRLLEDEGFVESKQRIGTYIKDKKNKDNIEKLTSKRELAVEILKRFILENNYSTGDQLLSTRKIAEMTGIPNTTLRFAATTLVKAGILGKSKNHYIVNKSDFSIEKIKPETLVEKIVVNLKKYLEDNFEVGDKIPTNISLAKRFSVSSKTMHDAIKLLVKEGFLHSRRGQYGTIILDNNSLKTEISQYNYEKIEQQIKHLIATSYQPNDKLPPIKELAQNYLTSEKTIKKALNNLAEDGYIAFARGRYGGTFVLDIPTDSTEAYKWLAITPEYIENLEN